MLKALFELFLLYMLYKLIFDFIIPVYQTTRQVKQKVNKMQRDIDAHMQQQSHYGNKDNTRGPVNTAPASKNDDYIDFEEVK